MKISILGGFGFIGLNLLKKLLSMGFEVHVFDQYVSNPTFIDQLLNMYPTKFSYTLGSLNEQTKIDEILFERDICFHLISTTQPQSSNRQPKFDIETNLVGTINILDACVTHQVKKLIYISSGGTVYGRPQFTPITEEHPTNPECSYGIVKLAIEKYMALYSKEHSLQTISFRLANPYGFFQKTHASQGVIAVFLGKFMRGEDINIWGDGSVTRDFIYIDDVVEALSKSISYDGQNQIFNLGSGNGVSIRYITQAIQEVTQLKTPIHFTPSRTFDVPSNELSIELVSKELHWQPTVDLLSGINSTYEWFKLNPTY